MRYRALCPSAVASIVVGALSILSGLHWSLGWCRWSGIGLGWRAIQRIRLAPDEWTGLGLARLGIGLSLGFWIVGYGWLLFSGVREVPYGYERVGYEMLQPDPSHADDADSAVGPRHARQAGLRQGLHEAARRQTGIKEFTLCPNNGECPFCTPNPKPTEMIRIVLQGDLETVYHNPPDRGGRPISGRSQQHQRHPL